MDIPCSCRLDLNAAPVMTSKSACSTQQPQYEYERFQVEEHDLCPRIAAIHQCRSAGIYLQFQNRNARCCKSEPEYLECQSADLSSAIRTVTASRSIQCKITHISCVCEPERGARRYFGDFEGNV